MLAWSLNPMESSSEAELLNGRVAMLGFIAWAFTEYVKGGNLVKFEF